MTWTLSNARLTKISNSANDEFVAIESIEVDYDLLTVTDS